MFGFGKPKCPECGTHFKDNTKNHTKRFCCVNCRARHYYRNKYHTDPEWRERALTQHRKWQKKTNYIMNRYHNDPEFRERMKSYSRKYSKRATSEGRAWRDKNREKYLAYQRKYHKQRRERLKWEANESQQFQTSQR